MKTLADCTPVPARTYYYLLDYLDKHHERPLIVKFKKERLCDTSISEYLAFFELAIGEDLQTLKNKL